MTEAAETPQPDAVTLMELTAEIVAAYVSHNAVTAERLSSLIGDVHAALARLGARAEAEKPALLPLVPAVPVKKSVFDDHLVSLIDGRSFSSLKRHIGVHGYTPDSYRTAFGLPADYPMVAPAYAAKRSELARTIGLGKPKPTAAAA